MKLAITFTSPFSDIVGSKNIETDFDADTIAGLLEALGERYPDLKKMFWKENGEPSEYLSIILNDRPISSLDGLESTLKDGDELLFFFPISGG